MICCKKWRMLVCFAVLCCVMLVGVAMVSIAAEETAPSTGIAGDVNGDGQVNNKDAILLFRSVSGWSVQVDEAALDVNGDGVVNNKDAITLFRSVSGWDVTIGYGTGGNICKHIEKTFVEAKESTCSSNGHLAHWRCAKCSSIFESEDDEEPVSLDIIQLMKKPHTEFPLSGYPATCSQTGLTDGLECTVCHTVLRAPEELPMLPHTTVEGQVHCQFCQTAVGKECSSYDEFAALCIVQDNHGTVTLVYDDPTPVLLKMNYFAWDTGKEYIIEFGPRSGQARVESNGASYRNIRFVFSSEQSDFQFYMSNILITHSQTVITSRTPHLHMTFLGDHCAISTSAGATGKNGKNYESILHFNAGNMEGKRGGDANIPVVCAGKLSLICGTRAEIVGGDGGRGGNGGNSNSADWDGDGGGRGGDGGNGAMAIQAGSIYASFLSGRGQDDLRLAGGNGGQGGKGGYSNKYAWFGKKYADSGNSGVSARATNIDIQYS